MAKPPKIAMARQIENAFEPEQPMCLPRGLHDRMMLEVETFIQKNWTSVALNDRYKVESIPDDHAFMWAVREEGTSLLPLFCKLSDRSRYIKAIDDERCFQLQAFFVRCQDYFIKFRNKYDPTKDKYYIIIKKSEFGGGDIIPSTFTELLHLVYVGMAEWTDSGIQLSHKKYDAWDTNWIHQEA